MRKTIKRLGAVLLAMAMAVSVLCTGALAAETSNSITITTTSSGHTYEAYQVFAGSTSATTDDKTSLGITGWGSGVKADELVTALTTESNAADSILSGKFTNILKKGNVANGVAVDADSADAAQNVAASIKDFSDKGKEAKAFAKIVAAHLSETKTSSTETKNSDVTTGYKIDNLAAGYYLVKDEDNSIGANKEDAYTNYIMEVVGAVKVEPKSDVPTVEKKIVENKAEKDATTAKVGDVVNFELTGTLPSNYADYKEPYVYEFHDILSKGLTYNGAVKVYVKNDNEEVEITGYTVTSTNAATETPTDATTITVKFTDLKTAKGKDNVNVTIDKNSTIIVKYSATLNENAVVGEAGNTNTVNLVYSNNPNNTSTGTTKDDKVTVYTFQLNVTKVDGTNNGTKLAGAKFKLYYETDNTKYYVKEVTDDNTIKSWTYTENEALELTTNNNGNITVKGLKEGTYYLEETEAPDGYNKLTAPVKVDIANKSNPIYELEFVKADDTAGTVQQAVGTITIANNKGSTLPSTGGMGTKLFYTIGGILMAGAAIVLVVRKRRSDAE